MNLTQRTSLLVLFELLFCTALGTAKEPTTLPQVPGSVIAHSPAASNIYLGSPAIAILNNGRYVAKCDLFGPGAPKENGPITRVFQSRDRGATWKHVTDVPRMFWASMPWFRNTVGPGRWC